MPANSLPDFCEVVEVAVGGGEFVEIAGRIGLAVKFAKATKLLPHGNSIRKSLFLSAVVYGEVS